MLGLSYHLGRSNSRNETTRFLKLVGQPELPALPEVCYSGLRLFKHSEFTSRSQYPPHSDKVKRFRLVSSHLFAGPRTTYRMQAHVHFDSALLLASLSDAGIQMSASSTANALHTSHILSHRAVDDPALYLDSLQRSREHAGPRFSYKNFSIAP